MLGYHETKRTGAYQRHPTMRAADLVVGRAKKQSPSEKLFPFRRLVLPPSR